MELFDSMASSIFGGTKSESVEPIKETSKITGQIQDNFKFLVDMAKDMASISKSVTNLVEIKGGMPATDANLGTTPEQVPQFEIVKKDKKGKKKEKSGLLATLARTLLGALSLPALSLIIFTSIRDAFIEFVNKNFYQPIKEKFIEFVSSIGSWFGGVADKAAEKLKTLKDNFVQKITDLFVNISDFMGEKIESIIEFFQPVTEFIKKVYDKFIGTLKSAIVSLADNSVTRSVLFKISPKLLEFAGVPFSKEEEDAIFKEREKEVRKRLAAEGRLINPTGDLESIMRDEGVSKKKAIEIRILQRQANQRLVDLEMQKLKEIEEQRGTDHTSQYKETSTYTAQVTPEEKITDKFQDYAQAPTTPKQVIPEGLPSDGPSSITKVAGDEDIKSMIIGHEGVRNRPYKDSLGLWTVGVGHLIGNGKTLPKEMDREFSDSEIAEMFEKDYAKHKKIAEGTPGYNEANEAGKGAMIDLGFNMGKWWPKWPNTSKALKAGNFEAAARGLEDSKWYTQVGNRAKTIVSLIESAGDKSGGSDLSVASAAIGAGQRALSRPKTPNVIDNSQINNTVLVKNENVNRGESSDYSGMLVAQA